MAPQLSPKRAVDPPPAIPDRLYFKIGDAARICGLETYVLRFWETQFPQLKPNKSGTGQRLYRRRDVELLLEIQRLVHVEGYTIAGARQALDLAKHDQANRQPVPQRAPQRTALPDAQPGPLPAAPSEFQSRLPLLAAAPTQQRLDSAISVIGHARAELREIACQLASPVSTPTRRRTRLAAVPHRAESLFPA
jgi:DNA-binding transcriptional MerR regulator